MIVLKIECDGGCGRVAARQTAREGRLKAHVLRELAKRKGWRYVERGGQDWCPQCWASRERHA